MIRFDVVPILLAGPIAGLVFIAFPAHAGPPPLLAVEARAAGGVAFGSAAESDGVRSSPVTIGAAVDHAIVAEPWTSLVGGLFYEANRRPGIGAEFGVLVAPGAHERSRTCDAGMSGEPGRGAQLRLGAGVVAIVAPHTLLGASASIGACVPVVGRTAVCADAGARVFALGDDLPSGSVAAQLLVHIGVRFDAR